MSDVPDFTKLPRILSQNGTELLPIEKYLFCMEDDKSSSAKKQNPNEVHWKCKEFKKKKCLARVHTNEQRKILKFIGEHSHPFDATEFDQLQFKTILMHLAKYTEWENAKIHKNLEIIFGKDKVKLHNKATLDRIIRKMRGEIKKREPKLAKSTSNETVEENSVPSDSFEAIPSPSYERELDNALQYVTSQQNDQPRNNNQIAQNRNCPSPLLDAIAMEVGLEATSSTEPANPELTCDICNKAYTSKRFLNYHYTSTHKQQKKNIKCAYSILDSQCNEKFRTRKDYEEHLQAFHKISLIRQSMTFNEVSEFETWKQRMEERTNSFYVLNRGSNKNKVGQTCRGYKCNRSGDRYRVPGKKTKKKPEDCRTMGAECPAYIKALIYDDKVEVVFVSTHVGHSLDIPAASRSSHQEAKKRIEHQRTALEEEQLALNSLRIRQEKLFLKRSDIIHQLNLLDLTSKGEKGDHIEKLLNMFQLTFDMFKGANKSDNRKEVNNSDSTQMDIEQIESGDNSDSIQEIL